MASLTITTRSPGVAQITMSRPAVFNAFDETMIGEPDAAFATLAEDKNVRVIVLAGEGKHFSAGADLQWIQRASTASEAWNLEDARRLAAKLARIEACPKPTVARVQGAAVGKRQALRLALTTARINAAEALAIGLVQQVVAVDALDAAIDATTRELLAGGPQAQAEIKQLFAQLSVGPITPEVRELTARTISRMRGTAEAREGFAAYPAKRLANWTPQ